MSKVQADTFLTDPPARVLASAAILVAGDETYLLDKVLGVASSGDAMPPVGRPLSTAEVDAIRAWIREGAADN